nr:tetratricopeptide repeat protein [Myxococcota bacterium]
VRNAVKMPSGPIDASRVAPAANRPTLHHASVAPPPQLPHLMGNHPPPQPLPPPPNQRSQIAAALPTAAALPMPLPGANPYAQTMMPQPPPDRAGGFHSAQQQSAAAVDAMFHGDNGPGWAQNHAQMLHVGGAGADEATRNAEPMDPQVAAMFAADVLPPVAPNDSVNQSQARPLKTGMRRARSRLQIAIWILLGALVIGGGVFAGFQIRAMRLGKQIAAARQQAVALAKADTWPGWIGARDRLAGIAQASATIDNRAALARARAFVAFEFGDGFTEANAAVDGLNGQGGLDGKLAIAYLALAESDAKTARTAVEDSDPEDAAVLHVIGHAQLLVGETKLAVDSLERAVEKEVRPVYVVGLARALGQASRWDDAIAAADRAIALTPEHPAAVVERATLLAASGRVVPGSSLGTEVRAQLEKVIADGAKPAGEPRSVSPAQIAFADLALARIDFARGDVQAAQTNIRNALAIGIDEQRFAEEVVDTMFATGAYPAARTAADRTLALWPASRRARTTLAEVAFAQGKVTDALDILSTSAELAQFPRALAVRGHVRFAAGDHDAARADFDAALKKAPTLELALVGHAWLALQAGDVEGARKRIESKFNAATATPALATVYAAILHRSGETGSREKARGILEKAVIGPPSHDIARAQLELARVYRDLGEPRLARKAYEEASRLPEARLESALLMIEDRDPSGGRDTLESLIKEAGDKVPANLLVEGARARMLVGDHVGAAALFEPADKAPGLVRWQLDRERGRLALRKADYAGAAQALARAIEDCGGDAETFLLAADAASGGKQTKLLDRVKTLAPKKLQGRPEAFIVQGKLALADDNYEEAGKAYEEAGKAFTAEKATPRRMAQANFGRAVSAYFTKNDPVARNALDLVIEQDPSIFAAYLYLGDMVKDKDPKRALELAQLAIKYNPDLVEGWVMLGTVASRLKNKKLRADAITRVGELAPNSEALRTLQSLP